jgi:hypothetical protein
MRRSADACDIEIGWGVIAEPMNVLAVTGFTRLSGAI